MNQTVNTYQQIAKGFAQLLEKKRYHRVVRLSQESSELALKALLAFCGLDVPVVDS